MRALITAWLLLLPAGYVCASADITKITFQEFDQTLKAGWRKLADEEKYEAAGVLIDEFIAKNPEGRPMFGILNFHAGQMYACAGKYDVAKKRFSLSIDPPTTPLNEQWNAYVLATIAFLEGDRSALEKNRAKIAGGPDGIMKASNLVVVDLLLKNLGKPYREASRDLKKA